MAKGDDKRARNRIDQQGGLAQNNLTNLREDMIIPQAQTAQNNYTTATNRSFEDYGKLMGGYEDFQKTGGFSPLDMANMRARSNAPIRSIYASANRDVNRQAALQGGYSPGLGTLKARMAREQSSALSDASQNTEGMLAQLRQQGKQFGLQGGSGLYGTAPGLAGHFGGMQNQAMNNWLQSQGLQNNLSLGIMGAQNEAANIKGAWQQGYENVLGGLKTARDIMRPTPTGG